MAPCRPRNCTHNKIMVFIACNTLCLGGCCRRVESSCALEGENSEGTMLRFREGWRKRVVWIMKSERYRYWCNHFINKLKLELSSDYCPASDLMTNLSVCFVYWDGMKWWWGRGNFGVNFVEMIMSNLLLTFGGMTFAWNGRGVGVNFDRTVDGFVADDRIKLLIISIFYLFCL